MSFIRPEIRASLSRSIEAIAGAALSVFGIWFAWVASGFMQIFGLSLAVAGAILVFAGIQRARFRRDAGGLGMVHVDEAQITYFGPLEGGSVSVERLVLVELEPKAKPAHWVLTEAGQPPLHIPINAAGADALFGAFATLPGIQTERMLTLLNTPQERRVTIWSPPGT